MDGKWNPKGTKLGSTRVQGRCSGLLRAAHRSGSKQSVLRSHSSGLIIVRRLHAVMYVQVLLEAETDFGESRVERSRFRSKYFVLIFKR